MPPKRNRNGNRNGKEHVKNRDITNESTVPATSPPAAVTGTPTASVFENARNIHIEGSSLSNTININTVHEAPLGLLRKRVALHAILNAGGRADKVKCHPGTRTEVISRIEKWRTEAQAGVGPPIFWLSGPAGAGKSAIVQTVTEGWKKEAIPQANFFFFRTDPSRNSLPPLVATLVHQIALLDPVVEESVGRVLSSNPLILDYGIEEQLLELIINPLRALQNSTPSYRAPVLVIDGLDECDSKTKEAQQQIIHAFDTVLEQHRGCICLLVASRDEYQIRATFNQISSLFIPLYLDNQYSPADDIRVFVNDEFAKIKKTHPLAHILDDNWPPIESINQIVAKSSGQFVYAATVMRFIAYSSVSPASSLDQVQNFAARTATVSPFSQLDAIHNYILSQVKDQESLKDILHTWTLIQRASIRVSDAAGSGFFTETVRPSLASLLPLLSAYNSKYTEVMVHSCLIDLTSIARYTKSDGLIFHHSSFPDYLLDQSRSGDSFVDLDAFNFKIMTAVWKCSGSTDMRVIALSGLSRLKELPSDLLETMVALNIPIPDNFRLSWAHALDNIHRLCIQDEDLVNYAQIIRQWFDTRSTASQIEDRNNFLPRCIRKQFMMISIERGIIDKSPSLHVKIGLTPATDLESREIALWLGSFLRRIHREDDGTLESKESTKKLLKEWISFAAMHKITPHNIREVPDAHRLLILQLTRRTMMR